MIDKKKILLPLASITLFIILGSLMGSFLTSKKPQKPVNFKPFQVKSSDKKKITIDDTNIFVDLAVTDEQREKGLSGVSALGEKEGLLFVFYPASRPSFWMKGMLIPIDIIWIYDSKIVAIDKNVKAPSPDTKLSDLEFYRPPSEVNYVLEVNAGFSDKHTISVGDSVDLSSLQD